jgi:ferredoxin--NADP+ reductase
LLLATVTGLAPFVSYVRTLYKDWKAGNSPMPGDHTLFCLQGSSRSWEFGYRDEMEKFAAEAPWFKYVTTVSRPWEDESWCGETGRVDDLIRKYANIWGLKRKTPPAICADIPTWWKTAAAFATRRLEKRPDV